MSEGLGRRPRLILVDDDPGLLRLLTLRLKSEGHDVAASESAAQSFPSRPIRMVNPFQAGGELACPRVRRQDFLQVGVGRRLVRGHRCLHRFPNLGKAK